MDQSFEKRTYTVTWSLKDTGNTTWSDNSTGNKSANWSINWVNGQSHYSNDIYNRGWGSGTFSYRCSYYASNSSTGAGQDQGMTYHDDCVEFWAWITRGEHDNNHISYYMQNSLVNKDNINKIHIEYVLSKGNHISSSNQRKCSYVIPAIKSTQGVSDSTMGTGMVNNIFGQIYMNISNSDLNFSCKVYRIWVE